MLARDAGEWSEQAARSSPEEIQAIIARYQAWSERVAEQGKLLAGEKLKDGDGRVLAGQRGSVRVTDGPHTASKEVIGGFWILRADSYEEAIEVAKDSPHLEFGSLELREIEEL
ncbi:MAG: YciI family protein [Gemmatimonadota bacterium]